MGNSIEYAGAIRATLHGISLPKSKEEPSTMVRRYVLVFNSLEDLSLLSLMNSRDRVLVDGTEESYEKFRREVLARAARIYLNSEDYFLDMFKSQSI